MPVRPRPVIPALLLPIVVLAYALANSVANPLGIAELPDSSSRQDGWGAAPLTIVVFAIWGAALLAATFIYCNRNR